MKSTRVLWLRLLVAGVALWGLLACGQQSCSCAEPLATPLDENSRIYDAIQARLTPQAMAFLESSLPDIIASFMPGGLVFDVPPTDASQEFGWCPICIKINIQICRNGCTLTAGLHHLKLTPSAPNTLVLDAQVDLSGTITINGTFDCEVPIDIRNKPVQADIQFYRDGTDHFLYFQIGTASFTISDSDYHIDCDWGFLDDIGLGDYIDDVVNWIAGLLTGTLNSQLNSQLNDTIDQAVADYTCLTCDYYTAGCPPGASCDGQFCQQGGTCRTMPMGMAGAVDLSQQLASLGSRPNPLQVLLAAGQWDATSIDPVVVNGGLELRVIGGIDAERNDCVPDPDAAEIPSNAPPERLAFSDTVPGTQDGFMAGIGVSDVFLDWALYKTYLTGLLCLTIGTETTDMLSSSTISLMGLGSLNTLTTGRNVPVKLKMHPTHVPYAEVGAGTFTTDADGNKIIDEPLLYLFLPGMVLDFWVRLDERWTRIMTVTMDISLDVALDVDADNNLVPLFDENSIHMDNVVVSNYELLAEDPAALANLLPTLVGMALPMLTGSLQPIAIPPMNGFVLDLAAIKGVKPRAGTPYHEYLGLWANLSFDPQAGTRSMVQTVARLEEISYPPPGRSDIHLPGGPSYPRVVLHVATASGQPAEYSWRLDGGAWHIFRPGPQLLISDPVLLLAGRHRLEVRARVIGDYRSLDPTPARLEFDIQPPGRARPRQEALLPATTIPQPAPTHTWQTTGSEPRRLQSPAPAEPGGFGCSSSGSPGGLGLLLLALILLRRKS